jgi:hypothetical protein
VPVFSLLVLCAICFGQIDSGIPAGVRYKHSYVNSVGKPPGFTSAMLGGIAIADTRVPGYQQTQVEIRRTQLICRVGGEDFVLNDDCAAVGGGL